MLASALGSPEQPVAVRLSYSSDDGKTWTDGLVGTDGERALAEAIVALRRALASAFAASGAAATS